MSNKETAKKVLMYVGGAENVKNVYHCATRLRFTLNHSDQVEKEKLQETHGVINVLGSGTQIQVVIGNAVNKVFDELMPMLPSLENASSETGEKGRIIDRVFNVISGIFAPYLPLIMCSGILTGLLSLASSMGWMNAESGTYAILSGGGKRSLLFLSCAACIYGGETVQDKSLYCRCDRRSAFASDFYGIGGGKGCRGIFRDSCSHGKLFFQCDPCHSRGLVLFSHRP